MLRRVLEGGNWLLVLVVSCACWGVHVCATFDGRLNVKVGLLML
jgi:hypothetical protein